MFRKISEGDVFATNKENSCTSGPRTAILADGSFACAFMVNSTGGANDFVPMIAYSQDGSTWTEAKPVWPELEGKKSVFVSLQILHLQTQSEQEGFGAEARIFLPELL